eukprot:TRINITY_DN6125_c0_g1_i11.p1 TRINITY_DN6125_c0_g1~~TRINITY_DN6125_c0_g1_i11.p1  ORF type:complete len:444 (-),score=72.12 TRINITY_DN6125_c0_g1_i11:167-1498(-)
MSKGMRSTTHQAVGLVNAIRSIIPPDYFDKQFIVGNLIIGSGIAFAGRCFRSLWNRFKIAFFVSLDINSRDESYKWVLEWMSEHSFMKEDQRLGVETRYTDDGEKPTIFFVPSVGEHKFAYKGKTVWINRLREGTYDIGTANIFEILTLSTFGWDSSVLKTIVREAMESSMKREVGKTIICTNSGGCWKKFGSPREKRPFHSVILPEGVMEELYIDLSNFLSSVNWYRERGIPYRRGYLLHGEPGSGKSSAIHALAGKLDMNICIISLTHSDMNDETLLSLLNSAPPRVILLLEDIDYIFVGRESGQDGSRVSFSGLLNALDGVGAQEGRVVFMTTNKIHQLDPALIREGRVDKKIHLGFATKDQVVRLFTHFYNLPSDNELSLEFSERVPSNRISMARILSHFMTYKNSPKLALEKVADFKLDNLHLNGIMNYNKTASNFAE